MTVASVATMKVAATNGKRRRRFAGAAQKQGKMIIGLRVRPLLAAGAWCLAATVFAPTPVHAVTVEITIPGGMLHADVFGHSPTDVMHFGSGGEGVGGRKPSETLPGGQVRESIEVEPCRVYQIYVNTELPRSATKYFYVPKDAPAVIKIEFQSKTNDFTYSGGVKTTSYLSQTHDLEYFDSACKETKAAPVPPAPGPVAKSALVPPAPAPAAPPSPAGSCRTPEQQASDAAERADVEQQLTEKRAEYARLKKVLDDDTHNMKVNEAVKTDRARAAATQFKIMVNADGKRLLSVDEEIYNLRQQLEAIDSRKPCPPSAPTAVAPPNPGRPPPPGTWPCYSPENAAQIAAQIKAYQAQIDQLTVEYNKLNAATGTGPAMKKNSIETAELQKKIDALKDLPPCAQEPKSIQVPPENEHGMAPTGPVMPGFGFGGFGFGFGGGGSDDGPRERGFNDRGRRP